MGGGDGQNTLMGGVITHRPPPPVPMCVHVESAAHSSVRGKSGEDGCAVDAATLPEAPFEHRVFAVIRGRDPIHVVARQLRKKYPNQQHR